MRSELSCTFCYALEVKANPTCASCHPNLTLRFWFQMLVPAQTRHAEETGKAQSKRQDKKRSPVSCQNICYAFECGDFSLHPPPMLFSRFDFGNKCLPLLHHKRRATKQEGLWNKGKNGKYKAMEIRSKPTNRASIRYWDQMPEGASYQVCEEAEGRWTKTRKKAKQIVLSTFVMLSKGRELVRSLSTEQDTAK